MYYYIVNPSSGSGSFADVQHRLKARLRQLDIDGEFAKTLDSSDAEKITRTALKRGIKTLVVIGGDKTVNEVITTVQNVGQHSVSVGIIPLGNRNTLAKYLGIEDWQQACELLAARRLQPFHLMHINDYSFIHSCRIKPQGNNQTSEVLAEIDGAYKVRGEFSRVHITNQKLRNINLHSRLLLQLYPKAVSPSWWDKLSRRNPTQTPAQLHSRVAILEFEKPQTAAVDGREFTDNLFRIRLSDTPIRLITAKQTEEALVPSS